MASRGGASVTVVIPTIREAELLRPTLDALDRQTLPVSRFDVIVVLDGPDDGRAASIEGARRRYRLRVLSSAGRGRAAACNVGAEAATGDILVFLDDDMALAPGALEAHLARHQGNPAAGVMAAVPVVVGPEATFATRHIARRFARHAAKLVTPGYAIGVRDVYTGAFSIERALFRSLGGFDRRFQEYGNEDGEFAGRLLAAGATIAFAPEAIAHQTYAKRFTELADDHVAKGRTALQFTEDHPDRVEESALRTRPRRSWPGRLTQRILVPLVADEGPRHGLARLTSLIGTAVEIVSPRTADRSAAAFLEACFLAGVRSARQDPRPERRRTVVHYTDARDVGGAERVALTLLEGLDRDRWRPVLLVHDGVAAELIDAARRAKIPVHVSPADRSLSVRSVASLARDIRRLRPALLHVHRGWAAAGNLGVLAGRAAGARVVATEHLYLPSTPRRVVLARRIIDRFVERTIVVSNDLRETMLARFHADPTQLDVVPNGISAIRRPGRAAVTKVRAELAARGPTILVPARLQRQKGHEVLLRAVTRLPDVTVVLAGEGPERSRLEAQAAHLGIADRVRFLGHRSDIPELMMACDLVVLPSLAEGLPLAVLEACSLARPVVATAVGGTAELITDGLTGRLVPAGDDAALGDAIADLATDPAKARRMATRAREVARGFTAEAMVLATELIYEGVLQARRGSVRDSRALDLLFLTGRSRHGTVAMFDGSWPGLDARADRVIDGASAAKGEADLVLATEPDAATIAAMRRALNDDGVLLATARRARGVARRYRDAGFPDPRVFAVWPDADAPRAFIPLDDPKASGRMLGRRRTGARGWLGGLRWRAWLATRAVGWGDRVVVGTPSGAPPIPDLARWWRSAGHDPVAGSVTWTILTGGRESRSKVVAVITPRDRDRPGLVIKWARDDVAAQGLAQEKAILRSLEGRSVGRSVPCVISDLEGQDGGQLVETMLPGRPLAWSIDGRRHRAIALAAADWLARLAADGQPARDGSTWVTIAADVVERFRTEVGPATPALVDATRQRLLAIEKLPIIVEHRDFAPWNVLVTDDRELLVADWESAVERGLPLLDLWYHLTYLALAVQRIPEDRLPDVYPHLMDPRTATGSVSRDAVGRYLDLLGLDHRVAPPLRALTWMVHLPSEIARSRPGADRSTMMFTRLWRHEAERLGNARARA